MTSPLRRSALLIVALLVAVGAWGPGSAEAASFPDVAPGHSYARQIEVLSQLGVISGYEDGTFGPGDPILRQQFAKMVVLAMRIPVSEADVSPFGDVESSGPGLYPDNYVAAAAREGITNGVVPATSTSPAKFGPYRNISLAQTITMVARAAGRPLVDPPGTYESVFGDFDPTHAPVADRAQYNGLLREVVLTQGDPARPVDVWRPATRGEAAALLYNLMGTDPEGLAGRYLGISSDLVRYFRDQGRTAERFTVPLEELARLYNKWSRLFGIRADMAWAQMIHETGFGEYDGDVLPVQNNFAGIGATGGGEPGNSFQTAELGVIAHIAHLAWYLYPDHFAHEYCRAVPGDALVTQGGDPRHFVIEGRVHRGNVRTVIDLGGKWAPSSTYGNRVLDYARGISVTRGW